MFKQCTKKFEHQQVLALDPDTCTLIDEEMMRCHFGVLFTPVTQHHVGRPARSLSLFTDTSYRSRLGPCVSTSRRSPTQRLTSDILHQCLVRKGGHVRWALETPTRELVSLWDLYRKPQCGRSRSNLTSKGRRSDIGPLNIVEGHER